jgi:hypothetical protein
MSNEKFKVKFGLAVGDTTATIDATTGDIVTAGDLAVNGGDITTTSTTANIVNATATTVNIAGAATTVSIGANTGTTTVNNSLVADDISILTVDTTNLEVTNIKAKDGTAAATIADSTGIITVSTELNVDNINISGNTISSTNTNGDIILDANGTGKVTVNDNLEVLGVLQTDDVTNANGPISITTGSNGDITLQPNGTGDVLLKADTTQVGDLNATATITTNGTGNLVLNTNSGTNSGSITIAQGVNGNITLDANGTGKIVVNDNLEVLGVLQTDDVTNASGPISITTGSNGDITLEPNGTGDVLLKADTVQIGDTGAAGATLTTNGASNLILNTNGGTNSGTIQITQGAGSNILLTPDTTGDVYLVSDTTFLGDQNAAATLSTYGTGDLTINTNGGTNSGSLVITAGANGAITLTPNGTGNFAVVPSNGGNLTNARNYVFGAIRDATTQANGDMWSFTSGAGTGYRGVSVDNSSLTTKRPGYLLRSYSGGASTPRSGFIYETSRGTAASPTALQANDFMGEFVSTGRTSTGWVSDLVTASPAGFIFYAAENFTGLTNTGAGFLLSLQPTGTTLTAGGASRITTMDSSPQQLALKHDSMAISAGKTLAFVATGCSVSGTTLTIGTVTSGSIAVGQSVNTSTQVFLSTYITANISGSGSGSTWTLSQSQTTASGLTIIGWKGAIGYAPGISTVDVLQPLKLYNGTITSRDNTYTLNNNAGTSFLTIGSDGKLTAIDPANSNNIMQLNNPTSDASSDNLSLLLQMNNAAVATDYPVIEFYNRRFSGGSYSPTQNGDKIGGYKFNGQYNSGGSAIKGVPSSIDVNATENWTATAQGTNFSFTVTKKGTSSSVTSLYSASDQTTLKSDAYAFQNSSGTAVTSAAISYTRTYGEFGYTNASGFNIPAQNTIYTMPLDTTLSNSGVTISGTGSVNINVSGWYKIIISLQATLTVSNQPGQFDFWLRKNGNDVTNSKTQVDLLKDQKSVISMDWLVNSNGSDYWEIVYVGTTTNYADIDFPTIAATSTPYVSPAAPALLVNVIPAGM